MDTFAAADAETANILQGRIADRSRSIYESGSVKFMVWLHDTASSHPNILSPQLLDRMKSAHLEDQQRQTKGGKPSTSRSSIRAAARASIHGIVAEDTETHPLNFADLTFLVFSRYLSTFKKAIKERGEDSPTIRLSKASFDGACSALSFLFHECGVRRDVGNSKVLWTKLGTYKRGSSRRGAQERKKLGVSTVEGKKHLPFKAYKKLAEILFKSDNPEHVVAHSFLVFDWNLVSRAEYAVGLTIDPVTFDGDQLLFDVGVTKTDQDGVRHVGPHSIFLRARSTPKFVPILRWRG